ncbi:DSC E3 ubiquitin ligase complex subunit 3 [Microdochium nivale]|nr:DSC E3 ubiquitin ligase complex subunit 3 [Microdochium nivale]
MATLKPPPAKQPPSNHPLREQPLLLTIRFAAALPDLELDILHPSSTTVVSLKYTIRSRLEAPDSERRLRFIHAGKILPDAAVLSTVLKAPLPPPPRADSTTGAFGDFASRLSGGRDKSRTREESNDHADVYDPAAGAGKGKSVPGRAPAQRIYVNCSIGASLTTAELETEAEAAAAPPPPPTSAASLASSQHHSAIPSGTGTPLDQSGTPFPSTTTAPRGFDRLLNAGFTSAEVNQLRLQFRSLNSSRFTPDTMPSPDSFRRMEDAWIDDNHAGTGGGGNADGGGGTAGQGGGGGGWGDDGHNAGGTDTDDAGLAGLTDVMIRGVATGFLWPLGSAGWLVREEGLASQRWRFMVGIGIAFSFLLGIIRTISGPVE